MHDPKPIDMILYCPNCGKQHIDAPEQPPKTSAYTEDSSGWRTPVARPPRLTPPWTNPPHRTHLCSDPECAMTWRPADVPTNGVASIKTAGKDDRWVVYPGEIDAAGAIGARRAAVLRAGNAVLRDIDRVDNRHYGLFEAAEISLEAWNSLHQQTPKPPPKRQYYCKVNGCKASSAYRSDCICWHDEGTGPRANDPDARLSWREAPTSAADDDKRPPHHPV